MSYRRIEGWLGTMPPTSPAPAATTTGSRLSLVTTMNLSSRALVIVAFLLASALVAAAMAWQGTIGMNLADEGYLWYGVQRVLAGEVPVRDFLSYDPGRYYWSAAWLRLWGDDGLYPLRISVALFQCLGLFAGLWVLTTVRRFRSADLPLLALAGVALLCWMYPRHKLFDIAISLLLLAAFTFWLRNPRGRSYFLAGAAVGLAAVFGRNHGVYGLVASGLAMGWLATRRERTMAPWRGGVLWGAGVVAGYSPILLMCALIPGFAHSLWQSVRLLFDLGQTNLALPVPWPWRADATLGQAALLRQVLIGLCFIGLPLFIAVAGAYALGRRWRGCDVPPAIVAACALAVPYAHFAYSRADVSHLAQGIFPVLVGCFALILARQGVGRMVAAAALTGFCLVVMLPIQPGWQARQAGDWPLADISGTPMQLQPHIAADVQLIRRLYGTFGGPGQDAAYVPYWPGAYALLHIRSPLYGSYVALPMPQWFQSRDAQRLAVIRPAFVLVDDQALDGREDLRFTHSQPILAGAIQQQYRLADEAGLPGHLRLYLPRGD